MIAHNRIEQYLKALFLEFGGKEKEETCEDK